ncbi:hypothetical protein CCAX7_37010 [Capsulimonas corticalis]|uniref:Uncharacterized protein n=1 Tax=Capsulimonas corticalis TaxID=2219043 RepID=A0A402D163_9BACT|nr:hypothetical protein [Capsulimonas corticalis]BDI31650.1 hypothetical protein CCAX7_37010 [Capsulimonas corticalis]
MKTNYIRLISLIAYAIAAAGCNHQVQSVSAPTQPPRTIEQIQNDPTLSPAVKAIQIRQLQDSGPPQRPPVSPGAH